MTENGYDPRHIHERPEDWGDTLIAAEHVLRPDGSCVLCGILMNLNDTQRALSEAINLCGRLQREPHLEYASARQLWRELRSRVWNIERSGKRVRPLNGHGTWLPIYWIFGAADHQSIVQPRFMQEVDHPYREGRGIGVRVPGMRLFEAGVCHRRNLEPDPDQYGEYDDPGVVAALGARVLDDDIAAISTEYRGVTNATAPAVEEAAEPRHQ